jgi:hypothetical protein
MTKMISVNVLGSRLNVLIPENLIEDEEEEMYFDEVTDLEA